MGASLGLYWVLLNWQVGFLVLCKFLFCNKSKLIDIKGILVYLYYNLFEKKSISTSSLTCNWTKFLCFCSPSWKLKLLTVFGYICLRTILRTTDGVIERLEIMTNENVRFLLSCIRMGQAERVRWSCHTKYLTRPKLHAQEHKLTRYIPKEHF